VRQCTPCENRHIINNKIVIRHWDLSFRASLHYTNTIFEGSSVVDRQSLPALELLSVDVWVSLVYTHEANYSASLFYIYQSARKIVVCKPNTAINICKYVYCISTDYYVT